ncbi:hypothetical protein FS749_000362 [Ceratobasidium sp. UAMH 11750]|nr:hypothetical protein FS749_000362 [Ceratobasidium sp. UAMH 11750]
MMMSYEFGFLCFRVIVLLIQVAVLAQMGILQAFLKETRNLSDPKDISATLAEFIAKPVDKCLSKKDLRSLVFGATTLPGGARAFLPTIGGFTDEDVSFLLGKLWRDRKSFSLICHKGQALTSGFAFVFFIIQEHMRWTYENACSNKLDKDWAFLDSLSFRCSLAAPSYHEVSLLQDTCEGVRAFLFDSEQEYDVISLVDSEDARNIMEAYINRISHPAFGRNLFCWDSEFILESVTHDSMLSYVFQLPEFVRSTFSWAWEELLDNDEGAILEQERGLVRSVTHALSFLT